LLFGFTRKACGKDHNCAECTGFTVDCRIRTVDVAPDLSGGECEIKAENDPIGDNIPGETALNARARSPTASAFTPA
jgi:hypothetical protein